MSISLVVGLRPLRLWDARNTMWFRMDIQMPELDGISATKLIRALPAPANSVPVVALTANAMIGDREKYLAAGMNDYVSKPINVVELTSALRRQCATASFQS